MFLVWWPSCKMHLAWLIISNTANADYIINNLMFFFLPYCWDFFRLGEKVPWMVPIQFFLQLHISRIAWLLEQEDKTLTIHVLKHLGNDFVETLPEYFYCNCPLTFFHVICYVKMAAITKNIILQFRTLSLEQLCLLW